MNDPSRYNFMASKKTLEINPYHPIIVELAKKSKDNADDDSTKELAFVLYDSSLITAGFDIDDQVGSSDTVPSWNCKEAIFNYRVIPRLCRAPSAQE